MNEEEKRAVEFLKGVCTDDCVNKAFVVAPILNLIEKQQKELNSLKEIEQLHRKVNGKLRAELEQEKEINKEIAIKNHKIKEESNAYREEIIRLDNELKQEKEKNKELEKQINLNKKTVEIAQTQILEYSQGYKDGLNKETTATAIVARELELNFIRQEIKHKYINKDKIREKIIQVKDKPIKDEFITATQGKLNTVIVLEELLED